MKQARRRVPLPTAAEKLTQTEHKVDVNPVAAAMEHQMGTERIPQSGPEGSQAQPCDFFEGWGRKQEKQKSEVRERISQICLYTCINGHVPAEKIGIALKNINKMRNSLCALG